MALTTRAQLRRDIGDQLGQMRACTATAAGTTTTFTDLERLATEDGHLVDRIAYVVSGTAANVSQQRRVSTNTKSTGTITLARALPAATAIGDVLELWNERGTGVHPDEVHRAIDRVIVSATESGATPVASTPTTFAELPIAIPADWTYFYGVEWEDTDDRWRVVPPADLSVDASDRTVALRGTAYDLAITARIRLHGGTVGGVLATDAATTGVDRAWIVARCCHELLYATAHRLADPVSAERRGNAFLAEANNRLPYVRSRPSNRFGKIVRLP